MWTYKQSTGQLFDKTMMRVGGGYAGYGKGKNNPTFQEIEDVGPLPQGLYTIKPPADTVSHGPFVLRLEPHPENQMFGRDGFLMHGDNKEHPGAASKGCIIQSLTVREQVWASGDQLLEVVE